MKKREIHIATSSVRHWGLACPQCLAPAEGVTGLSSEARAPVLYPGAIVICIECASINIVTPEMKLRPATAFEQRDILQNEEIAIYVQACVAAHVERRGKHVN